ncbi:hypothetical protein MACJ_001595 [Theileria orientalis]|uniref:Uncharacterized protein n=1 Tax=Theileria orientalis TaxID=68886 RepID=A0A976M8J2_THEOR|nr:hypothetical protein MACJ_001595 [Theileria orientalis]
MGKNSSKRKKRKRGSEYAVVSAHDTGGRYVGREVDGNVTTNGTSSMEKEGAGYLYNGTGVPTRGAAGSVDWSSKDDLSWRLENARYLLNRRLMYNCEMNVNDRRKPSWPINYSLQNKIEDFISKKIADATEYRNKEPTTLSICNQFALQNHEAMVADSDRVHYYRAAIFWTGFSEYQSPGGATVRNRVGVIMEREDNSLDPSFPCDNMDKDLVKLSDKRIGSAVDVVDMDSKLADVMDHTANGIATPVTVSGVNISTMDKTTDFSNDNEDCHLGGNNGGFDTIDTTPRIEDTVEYKGGFSDLESLDGALNQCFESSLNELGTFGSKFATNLNYKTGDMSYEDSLEGLPPMETNLNTCYSDSLHSRSTSINLDSSIYSGSEGTTTSLTNGVKYYCTGKKILEIGTGPMCVLAMNALKAGAKSVDALEVSDHASRLAGKLMAAYGFDNIIKVFNTHSKLFVFNQNEYFSDTNSNASSTITTASNSLNSSTDSTTTNAATRSNHASNISIISSIMADGAATGADIHARTNSTANMNTSGSGKGVSGIDDNSSVGFSNASHKGSSEGFELKLPPYPPYDMVISEILGDFASQEGVADVFLDFQRRILFENKAFLDAVKSIPCRVSTMFVPSFFPDASNILNKSSSDPEMTIFSPSKKMLQSVGMRIDNLPICEEWLPLEHIDLEKWMLPQMCQHYVNVFKVAEFGDVAGLLVGIDVEIRPGEHFGTRYGQCESWYTNLLMFDREYTVFENDLIVVSSVANLTNYTKVSCDSSKIQVSRPSYGFKAYILSPINFEAANYEILQSIPPKRSSNSRARSSRGHNTPDEAVDSVLPEDGMSGMTAEDATLDGVAEEGDYTDDGEDEGFNDNKDECDADESEQLEEMEPYEDEEDVEMEHLESGQLSDEEEDRVFEKIEEQDQEVVEQESETPSEQVPQKPAQCRPKRTPLRPLEPAAVPGPVYITSVDAEVFNLDEFIKVHSGDKCTNSTASSDNDTANHSTTKNNHSITTNEYSTSGNNHSSSNEKDTTAANGTNLKGRYSVKLKCNELMKVSYDVTDRKKINFDSLNRTHESVSTECKYADDILESHEYVQLEGEIYKVIHRPEVIYIDYDEQTSTIYYDTPCAKRKMHTDPPKRYNKIKLKTAKSM